jgi:hypothetical protein
LQTDLPALAASGVKMYSVFPSPSTRTEPSDVSPRLTVGPPAAADAEGDSAAADSEGDSAAADSDGASDAAGWLAGAAEGVVAPPPLLLHAAMTRVRPSSGATRDRVRILG